MAVEKDYRSDDADSHAATDDDGHSADRGKKEPFAKPRKLHNSKYVSPLSRLIVSVPRSRTAAYTLALCNQNSKAVQASLPYPYSRLRDASSITAS